jgi:general secretion pathway protein K
VSHKLIRADGKARERGFALVLTLVVIVALSIMTEIMTRWVSAALNNAFSNREEVDAKRQIAEAEAISLYILGTRPFSFRGLEPSAAARRSSSAGPQMIVESDPVSDYIRLDDHPYWLGDAVIRFQDARGLINLNLGSYDDLYSLLGIFGVSADDRGPLVAKLQDYIDADSLTRLNGAEAPEYADAGREPPANAPLRTPWEVRRILDWDKAGELVREDSQWALLATTAPFDGFNVNTAPRALLSVMPGITEAGVDNIVRWRREHPIIGGRQFGIVAGLPIPQGPSRFLSFPTQTTLITFASPHLPLERRLAVRLTPESSNRPWAIGYDVEMPRPHRAESEAHPDALPVSAILSSVP